MGRRNLTPIKPGMRFGRLTVIGRAKSTSPKNPQWECRCNCGGTSQPRVSDLRNGRAKSCGCLKNKGFKNYGGRGIKIAPEWVNDFVAFRDYINQNLGPRPKGYSLDRIENDEGYEVGNLRWSPRSEQRHNSRTSRVNKVVDAALRDEFAKLRRQRSFRRVY